MRVLFVVLALLLPVFASADPQQWMKKVDPENIFVSLLVSPDCPDDFESYKGTVEGVLIRSRLNSAVSGTASFALTTNNGDTVDWTAHQYVTDGKIFLRVSLNCRREKALFAFDLHLRFAFLSEGNEVLMYATPSWNAWGRHSAINIRSALETSVKDAIDDYLNVNFDLAKDDD